MALVDTKHLPKVDFAQQQRQAQSQVQANPFGNLGLEKMKVEQDPNYGYAQQVRQQTAQPRTAQSQPVQRQPQQAPIREQSSGVVGQKVVKRTKRGDTYSYADKYDHSKDIKPRKVVPITFRIDADVYEKFKEMARRQRTSVNQLMMRAMEQFRG